MAALSSEPRTRAFVPKPSLPPPRQTVGAIGWLRANLFSDWFNSLLTLLALAFLWKTVPPLLSWTFLDAVWTGGPDACGAEIEGACWAFVGESFRVFMVGTYPAAEIWRPTLAMALLVALGAVTMSHRLASGIVVGLWLVFPIPVYWLIGGGLGLAEVDQATWGGLMLSLILAIVGILVSLPLGVLLALGRHSGLPLIKAICVGIIEPVRGVPLITILFMASVMMPLFLPVGIEINNLLRVQVGIIMFSAAYMAEVVRGGLQAIPAGQYDAARALGLNYWKTTAFIVLPQALRHVLSPLIGRSIALFKGTTLVIIIGLFDFLGAAKAAAQNPDWLGYDAEAYVFCAITYWVICFSMSRYGRSIERRRQG